MPSLNQRPLLALKRNLLSKLYTIVTSHRLWGRIFCNDVRASQISSIRGELSQFSSEELVSVVLPVNNGRSRGVERLVTSLKNQSHKNIEWIAVDSGSTDDTVAWLRTQGFKVIEIRPDQFSHSFSRNTGASLATGKYILFVVDDVVFTDPNWLRTGLFLLQKFQADSFSSRQTCDEKADDYAKLLAAFLERAQRSSLGVTVSRSSLIRSLLRKALPLRSQFRSVCVDDTNHLVVRSVFDKLKFQKDTVEDLDFGIRLTQSGGKFIYTNLTSVLHYHKFTLSKIGSYAKRVFLDTRVMSVWAPNALRLDSRDSFTAGAFQTLVNCASGFEKLVSARTVKQEESMGFSRGQTSVYLENIHREFWVFDGLGFDHRSHSYNTAKEIFFEVLGSAPPSNFFYQSDYHESFNIQLTRDLSSALDILFSDGRLHISSSSLWNITCHLWCNRLMTTLGDSRVFGHQIEKLPCDSWDKSDWT